MSRMWWHRDGKTPTALEIPGDAAGVAIGWPCPQGCEAVIQTIDFRDGQFWCGNIQNLGRDLTQHQLPRLFYTASSRAVEIVENGVWRKAQPWERRP